MNGGYDYKRYAVVYADDEDQSRKYFRKAFEKDLRVLTAASAGEALALVEREGDTIGVLITDQRMPGQTGVELLKKVRSARPNIVRILTTAYTDLESAIEAVNSGAIFQYITKPWDLRDLRGRLLRAMEFFVVQQERDLLLREKLSVLQRIVVADRIRSFAMLAAGLAHHIRNSMGALQALLDLPPARSPQGKAPGDSVEASLREDLWPLAAEESQRILEMVQRVADAAVPETLVLGGETSLRDAAERGAAEAVRASAGVRFDIDPELPPIKADPTLLARLFTLLVGRALGAGRGAQGVAVVARERVPVWGTPGVRVLISADGPPWSEETIASFFTLFAPSREDPSSLGLDLLSAFFIAQRHGGDLVVHRDRPHGPGFELLLPFDPDLAQRPAAADSLAEKVLANPKAWEQWRGGV